MQEGEVIAYETVSALRAARTAPGAPGPVNRTPKARLRARQNTTSPVGSPKAFIHQIVARGWEG